MVIEMTAALAAGLCLGGGIMYQIQRKHRMQELKKLGELAEDIMNEKDVRAEASGEEIAHQMRTPLTNMETYTGLLRERLEDTAALQYIGAVEESERKLHFLAESFIKMSRLEQHVIQIRKEETDIRKTVQNALGQIQNQAEERRIRFEISLPEKAVCMHDANWLGEALYNILDNAVKYSAPGGRVELSARESEMFLKIRVRDYGLGIDPGEESWIFRRFYRGSRVTTQEGFGIGLYLAREIVNRHGGFLTAKRMEPGVQMEISLPAGAAVQPKERAAESVKR